MDRTVSVYGCSLNGRRRRHHEPHPDPAPVARRRRAHVAARRGPLPRAGQPDVGGHEVRARVVDVQRETARHRSPRSRCSRPTPGAASAPASTSRSASRSTASAHTRLLLDQLLGPAAELRRPRLHDHRARPRRRARSRGTSSGTPRPGTVVHLSQAEGDFVLPTAAARRKLLMISGGSGITPVMSMLRSLRRRSATRAGSPSCTTPAAPRRPIFADGARRARRPSTPTSTCTVLHTRRGRPSGSPSAARAARARATATPPPGPAARRR